MHADPVGAPAGRVLDDIDARPGSTASLLRTIVGLYLRPLGGWISGVIFDLTGSYQAAFLNGIGFNALNVSIMTWLLFRSGRGGRMATAAA